MKIRLVCSAGMSTSMLVTKMKEAAEEKGVTADIEACAESQLSDHLADLDVVLIGPQVRFLEKKLRSTLEPKNIKVDIIDQMAYGMMQGDKVLDQALNMVK